MVLLFCACFFPALYNVRWMKNRLSDWNRTKLWLLIKSFCWWQQSLRKSCLNLGAEQLLLASNSPFSSQSRTNSAKQKITKIWLYVVKDFLMLIIVSKKLLSIQQKRAKFSFKTKWWTFQNRKLYLQQLLFQNFNFWSVSRHVTEELFRKGPTSQLDTVFALIISVFKVHKQK